jgi:hypothetical protein
VRAAVIKAPYGALMRGARAATSGMLGLVMCPRPVNSTAERADIVTGVMPMKVAGALDD